MIKTTPAATSARSPWRPRLRLPSLPRMIARSLTLKLTLAFLAVGLTGALLVALSVGQRTRLAFDQFVLDRGQRSLVVSLAQYYQMRGSWEGLDEFVRDDHFGPGPARRMPIVLADPDGRVILGSGRYRPGALVSPPDRALALPVEVQGHVVGLVIGAPGPRRVPVGTPESDLLARITHAITFSALAATGLALLLGFLLARTLTHPIRELTAATRQIAKGGLGRQVAVRSRDELGILAASFNRMSVDLERSSALRRQMTADIAHDLRTPLSVILGYTEALRDGKLGGSQEIFDTLHTEAQQLQRLVDDLRTLSLADAGELPLTRQPVAPQALLERAAAAYRPQAQAQNIAITARSAPDVPPVDVDPERMAQVLGNLLSNALRYTPHGGTIALSTGRHDGSVELCVSDTGSGISPEDLGHVFERFYRGDESRQHDGSSGLGLAIAKSIVEAHGGTIAVASAPGQGTTFTIDLPAHQEAAHAT